MKIVFIAGPYIGDHNHEAIENNIRMAEQFAIALANEKIGFFCPHLHTAHFQEKTTAGEDFYYALDFDYLTKVANAVLALPGWEDSKGAKIEVAWAKEHGLPIFYPSTPDDIGEIIKWYRGL